MTRSPELRGDSLSRSFFGVVGDLYRDVPAAQLDAVLTGALAEARQAWPRVSLSGAALAQFLAARVPDQAEPATVLAGMRIADLYLACACAEGAPGGAEAFEHAIMPAVRDAIRRVDRDAAFVDEVAADVRVKLLVRDGARPARITRYLGRGPLSAFAQVVGMRQAQSTKRRRGREDAVDADSLLDLALGPDDPELRRLLDEVRGPFRAAFREALGELSARQRNVLRLYLLEDLSSETIGTMHGVHRATVARWITEARAAVLRGTKRRLMRGLELGEASVVSLIGRLQSQLEVSLAGFLAEGEEAGRG